MNDVLWTSAELEAALGAPTRALGAPVRGVSIDTRTLQDGDLFFAIRGEANDGHAYVESALAAGAAAAAVERDKAAAFAGRGALFPVDDTLRALERLGAPARASPRSPARSARPAPRKCCASYFPRRAPFTPRRRLTTIIGACR
jgi:UDP-N-acetylmuramoyl-tripeptide--D-alanyl-D-alanine ligase